MHGCYSSAQPCLLYWHFRTALAALGISCTRRLCWNGHSDGCPFVGPRGMGGSCLDCQMPEQLAVLQCRCWWGACVQRLSPLSVRRLEQQRVDAAGRRRRPADFSRLQCDGRSVWCRLGATIFVRPGSGRPSASWLMPSRRPSSGWLPNALAAIIERVAAHRPCGHSPTRGCLTPLRR